MEIKETKIQLGENIHDINVLYDNAQLIEKTGIRYVFETSGSTVNLAKEACQQLTYDLKAIKLLMLVTQSPDDFLPANSISLADTLNVSNDCLMFDLNQGCSGFVQALCVIDKIIGHYKNVLLVTADRYRSKLKKDDRSTRAVFSDCATANVITGSGDSTILFEDHFSDGSKKSLLCQAAEGKDKFLYMSGAQVWMFTKIHVVQQIKRAISFCEENNLNIEGIYVHQASKVVVQGISKAIPEKKHLIFENFEKIGNTVSSTIPCMFSTYPIKLKSNKSVVIMSGFGVGLTSSTIVFGANNG